MNNNPATLSPYATLRSNPFYKAAIESYVRIHGLIPPPPEAMEILAQAWMTFHEVGAYLGKQDAIEMESDCSMVMMLLTWWTSGKNCFVFTKELIDEFLTKESKAEDIPASILRIPYPSLYVKFGKHSGIRAIKGRDRWVDGCYLEKHKKGIVVTYTQIADDESVGGTGLDFLFRLEGAETVDDALKAGIVFEEESCSIEKRIASEVGGDAPRFFRDIQSDRDAIREQRDEVAPKVARLVASCLAYILFVPDDIEESFLNAPAKLVAKYNRASTPKEKARNLSKLEASGYSVVKLCGKRITDQIEDIKKGVSSVRPHWRRGHWRMQPVGVGLSHLKLTWVRPTIVRPDRGEPEYGHLYKS